MMRPLCRIAVLNDPGSDSFVIDQGGIALPIMVVRSGGRLFGYVNSCPHTGGPLDWQSGKFLDFDQRHILCASHGALFRIEDGVCLGGPCAGKALTAVPLVLKEGIVYTNHQKK